MGEPSPTGKRRYPPDGIRDGEPCTCFPECRLECRGASGTTDCGCVACEDAYYDALAAYRELMREPNKQ